MKRLNVESFELFQLHSVGTMEALDEVTAPGGAVEALVELREQDGTTDGTGWWKFIHALCRGISPPPPPAPN